jgi:hypothetical protein
MNQIYTTMTEMIKNNPKDTFLYYSIRERIAIKWLCDYIKPLHLVEVTSAEGFDAYDAILSSCTTGKLFKTEVKVRKINSNKYEDIIIEAKKFFGYFPDEEGRLCKHEDYDDSATFRLFVTFFANETIIWDMNKIKDENVFRQEELRHTSVDGNQKKVMKMVSHIHVEDALMRIPFSINQQLLDFTALHEFFNRTNRHFNNGIHG